MLLRLAFLFSVPMFGAYTQSAVVNLPTYAQGLTNFPYLISCNSTVQNCPQFKAVANGGQVQNSSGFDIAFYADSGCSTTKLNWETEDWSASTGNGDWWVQVPGSTNTFYECWDNSSISTDQSSKTATWSGENYQFVMHGGTPSTFSGADSSASNLSGTATSVSAATGIVNGAGSYNGSSSQVSFPNPAATQCSPTCTLEAWIKTSFTPSGQCMVANQWHFGPSPSYGITLCEVNTLSGGNGQVAWGNSGGFESANAMYPLSDGNWHAVALTYSSGTVDFYVDGVLRGSWLSTFTSISYSTQNLMIGSDSNSAANYFHGDIDEVRISSDAKTAAWLNAAYQNVANAELTVQPIKQMPRYLSTMYYGGTSCASSGMTMGASLDGINWTSIFNLALTDLQVPMMMQWKGYLWLVYSEASSCSASTGSFTVVNTPLPLTSSSSFSAVATITPSLGGLANVIATNWFIGDDGIPNVVFFAGSGSTDGQIYLITPTDTTGLTTWNTSATQLTSGSTKYADAQLVELNPSSFVLIVKDLAATTIGYFTSSSKTGTYALQTNDFGFGSGYEAPHVMQTSPGTWTIWLDSPGTALHYATTTSFPTGWGSLTQYFVYNCGNVTGNPNGYCFHPIPIPVQGKNGAQ